MARWRDRLGEQARARSRRGLERVVIPATPLEGGRVERADGVSIDLCSNDYLGLSRHAEVIAGAREAAERFGAGARASRLITGSHPLVEELEAEIAAFKEAECALVYPSGYQANLGLCATLIERGDAVFVDRLAHSCLVDGVRLSGARLRVFPHNDVERLDELLAAAANAPARWVLCDGVYSMDGDLAPLDRLLEIAALRDATVILDDAHGTGVTGRTGRGTAEHFNVAPRDHGDRLIVVATLSKALGAQGGVVLGPRDLREGLVGASRPFVYSTGIAPPAAGAALAALRVLRREPGRVEQLGQMAASALQILRAKHLDTLHSQTPIIPIIFGDSAVAMEASAALRERGLLVLPIRPPTVPRGTSRLRLTVTANQNRETTVQCCETIGEVCRYLLSRDRRSGSISHGG